MLCMSLTDWLVEGTGDVGVLLLPKIRKDLGTVLELLGIGIVLAALRLQSLLRWLVVGKILRGWWMRLPLRPRGCQ